MTSLLSHSKLEMFCSSVLSHPGWRVDRIMYKNLPTLSDLNRLQQFFHCQPRPESDIAQPARFWSAVWAVTRHLESFPSLGNYLSSPIMCQKYVIFLSITDLSRFLSVPAD